VYSVQEVSCIAKGKLLETYEFGSKPKTFKGGIIMLVSYKGNPYDSQTIAATLTQHRKLTGIRAKRVIAGQNCQKKEIERNYQAGRKETVSIKKKIP
jgi:IS5 family transposase